MKRFTAGFLAFFLCITLLCPAANAAYGGFNGEPYLSTAMYTPSENNCLYVYVPLTGSGLTCQVSIFDAWGVLVYQQSRENLSTNIQTFFWDACPAPGNSAGYDPDDYVSMGDYTVEVQVTGDGVYDARTLTVWIGAPSDAYADEEAGIPNYTGNAQCDYLASLMIDEIGITPWMTNEEKYYAIYTWVQGTFYRENSEYQRPVDESGYYYDLDVLAYEIEAFGALADADHADGYINYDVHGDLHTRIALKMMLERVGTCYEFSSLLQILLEHVGIECHVYGGYFHNSNGSVVVHKWNMQRLNGTYYWSDVRIDNASYERSGRVTLYYDHYLEEDTDIWKKRHSWDETEYPIFSTATQPIDGVIVDREPEEEPDVPETPSIPAPSGVRGSADYSLSRFTDLSNRRTTTTSATLTHVDVASYSLEAYNIDGYNYFKLRDIAFILSGSDVQFDVGWSEADNCISLMRGMRYTLAGDELTKKSLRDPIASPTMSAILLDGDPVDLCAYFINGNNYFKLRDLAILFNFAVGWSEADNAITIDSRYVYSE